MDRQSCTMLDRYEQVDMYSRDEFIRRWTLTRRIMQEHDCQALLVCSAASEGFDQWLTGVHNAALAILPMEGPTVAVLTGCVWDGRTDNAQSWVSHINRNLVRPLFEDMVVNEAFDVRCLGCLGRAPRIGMIHGSSMSAALKDHLEAALPGAVYVDLKLPLSLARAVKSPEELAAIRKASLAHEKTMAACMQIIRPGRTLRDVSHDIMQSICLMGAGNALIHAFIISIGEQDGMNDMRPYFAFPGRTFAYGDRLFVLLETNGPGGHITAIGRFFSIGEPSKGYRDAVDISIRSQDLAASMLRPGETLSHIARETGRFIEASGYGTAWDQCFMHGMGYFMYEQYALHDMTSDIPLQENVMLHAHPVVKRFYPGCPEPETIHHLDAYIVRPQGGQCTNRMPRKLFVIE